MHELLGRLGFGREDDVLLDKVDLKVEFVHADPVLKVPIEAVRFLDQQNAACPTASEEGEHLSEAAAPCLFGRLHVNELADYP